MDYNYFLPFGLIGMIFEICLNGKQGHYLLTGKVIIGLLRNYFCFC